MELFCRRLNSDKRQRFGVSVVEVAKTRGGDKIAGETAWEEGQGQDTQRRARRAGWEPGGSAGMRGAPRPEGRVEGQSGGPRVRVQGSWVSAQAPCPG